MHRVRQATWEARQRAAIQVEIQIRQAAEPIPEGQIRQVVEPTREEADQAREIRLRVAS